MIPPGIHLDTRVIIHLESGNSVSKEPSLSVSFPWGMASCLACGMTLTAELLTEMRTDYLVHH